MGSTNNGARIVKKASAVLEQRTGPQGSRTSCFALNMAYQIRGQAFQCTGKDERFNGKDRNMTLAAVAGTTFFAGNILTICSPNFKTAPIDLSNKFLIVPDYLQPQRPFVHLTLENIKPCGQITSGLLYINL